MKPTKQGGRVGRVGLMLGTALVAAVGFSTAASAQTTTTLYSFTGYPSDGASPTAGLIRDASGALYGTTINGGAYGTAQTGAVFKLTPPAAVGGAWTETVLHHFGCGGG